MRASVVCAAAVLALVAGSCSWSSDLPARAISPDVSEGSAPEDSPASTSYLMLRGVGTLVEAVERPTDRRLMDHHVNAGLVYRKPGTATTIRVGFDPDASESNGDVRPAGRRGAYSYVTPRGGGLLTVVISMATGDPVSVLGQFIKSFGDGSIFGFDASRAPRRNVDGYVLAARQTAEDPALLPGGLHEVYVSPSGESITLSTSPTAHRRTPLDLMVLGLETPLERHGDDSFVALGQGGSSFVVTTIRSGLAVSLSGAPLARLIDLLDSVEPVSADRWQKSVSGMFGARTERRAADLQLELGDLHVAVWAADDPPVACVNGNASLAERCVFVGGLGPLLFAVPDGEQALVVLCFSAPANGPVTINRRSVAARSAPCGTIYTANAEYGRKVTLTYAEVSGSPINQTSRHATVAVKTASQRTFALTTSATDQPTLLEGGA